jgi:hypothetical protein
MSELLSEEIDLIYYSSDTIGLSKRIADLTTKFINQNPSYKLINTLWIDKTFTLIIFYKDNDH